MLDANKMTEPELERMFKREVEKVDGLCYKFVSPGNAGVPDRAVIFPTGLVFFCELKRPGERLRPLQRKVCRDIHHNHGIVLEVVGVLGVARMLMYAGYQDSALALAQKYKLNKDKVLEAFNDDWWAIRHFIPAKVNKDFEQEIERMRKGGDA